MQEDDALAVIMEVAEEREAAGIVAEARRARRTLGEGRFNVAVLGQFKRGKSTLINALLGQPLLPTDVAPLTSTITIVEYGEQTGARALYTDGRREVIGVDAVADYVSEEGNPGNARGIEAVVVTVPVPLLAGGVRLVDTPGVGSVFAPNSEVTRRYLPRIDVALLVLGFDPPISGEELAIVREIAPHVGRLAFVLNKADVVDEQVRQRADAFTRKILASQLGERSGEIFHASARRALEGGGDAGVAALAGWLGELAASSAAELARGSARRACRALGGRLLQDIELEVQALSRPLAELDRQIQAFRTAVRDIDALALAATVRVQREESQHWAGWQEERKSFERATLLGVVKGVLDELKSNPRRSRSALRSAGVEAAKARVMAAVEEYRRHSLEEFRRFAERRRELVEREATALIDRVSAAASSAFGMEIAGFEARGVEVDPRAGVYDFVAPVLALDPTAWLFPLLDALLPRSLVVRRIAASARRLAADWLRVNLYEVDRHLTDWLDALRSSLEGQLRECLDSLQEEVLHAVEHGRQAQEQGQAAVRGALDRLALQRHRLTLALAPGERGEGLPASA